MWSDKTFRKELSEVVDLILTQDASERKEILHAICLLRHQSEQSLPASFVAMQCPFLAPSQDLVTRPRFLSSGKKGNQVD